MKTTTLRAAVIGASGYTGVELLRLLARRPDVTVVTATADKSVGLRAEALYPDLTGVVDLRFEDFSPDTFPAVDVAFVALPSGRGMETVPFLRGRADRIIDLGGDFRLKSPGLYAQYYGHTHTAIDLLREAVYGLPEVNRTAILSASLIANPGCYPTSAILGLLPALIHGLIDPGRIVVNTLSGVSGAGRSGAVETSFAELNENVRAYKVGVHQHAPEIEQVLRDATGLEVTVSFVPHLLPITRGIYTTIHAPLNTDLPAKEAGELYEEFYAGAPFVRIRKDIPQIQSVARTNFCDIGVTVDRRTRHLIVISTIDNLVKGAAGQAIQNMNIMFGLPEGCGLL
jgi:N-acetyl-gamma-glutamyl-phosphate reductase